MGLELFRATDFRCLESLELSFDASANLITGPNASGKTSILEAIAYLGRGKSFRGASNAQLIRHGQKELVVFGRVMRDGRTETLGVRNGPDGIEISVGGESDGGLASLADALPLQIIDPDIHDLVAGGPENRRRYLDWIAFHVEPGYLDLWRRFRRSLKQRNAALRSGPSAASLDSWDQEFAALGSELDGARQRVLDIALDGLEDTAAELLQQTIGFEYRAGWASGEPLLDVLRAGRERDQRYGSTQYGPHRADLTVSYEERQARKLVSRGQQKLLACSMILAATELAQTALEQPLLLLLDDPAAELDGDSLARLMVGINQLGCQIVATALVPDAALFASEPAVFHVEHGTLSAA